MFATLDLARQLDAAEGMAGARFIEARRQSAGSRAGWTEIGGAIALFDGPDSPVTQAFAVGLFQGATPAVLDRLEEFFQSRGADPAYDLCPLAGVSVAQSLAARGFVPVEHASVLYLRPSDLPVPCRPAAVTVRPIERGEETVWAGVAAQGWRDVVDLPEMTSLMATVAARDGAHCFLAEADRVPVAAAALFVYDGVAVLAGASTLPQARRRGAQAALLRARLEFAAHAGCTLAMMCAEPGSASQRNAERGGFRIAYTRTKWRLNRGATLKAG